MNRRRNTSQQLPGSEHELAAMTTDLHEIHHDLSLPALQHAVYDMQETTLDRLKNVGTGRTSRRTFLLGTGAAAAGGILLAACSSQPVADSSKSAAIISKVTSRRYPDGPRRYPADLTGDLKVAALSASLENLAVYTYTAGINAATAGKLGSVPPAVVNFAQTARSQHEQHAAAWNSVLTAAGKPKVTENDPALTPTVNTDFAKVTDVTGLATLALTVETIAAQTYQAAVSALSSAKAIGVAATIQPVEMQHMAILNFVLGTYPVPNAFEPTSEARTTSDLNA